MAASLPELGPELGPEPATASNWNRARKLWPPAASISMPTCGLRMDRSCSRTAGLWPTLPRRLMANRPPLVVLDPGGSIRRRASMFTSGRRSAGSNSRSRAAWWHGGCSRQPGRRACMPSKTPSTRGATGSLCRPATPMPTRRPSRPLRPAANRPPKTSQDHPAGWERRGGLLPASSRSPGRMPAWRSSASS